jgi:virulence-associated protein VapD
MIDNDISESNAKKLIIEKKYTEAIVILRQLNFSNPKKSVYFADQIRFLEKVIEISKK